ncbi:MAG TPA: extracellular solute-binding protein [Streptosporangiaceae bacterium]|nr:extracellular solute-binding protein [Streptosporangiaceae bacterium]
MTVKRGLGWRGGLVVLACAGLAAAGCGSASSIPAAGSAQEPGTSGKPSGTADVAYASSLEFLNEQVFGPAFTKAEGFTYSGRAGASGELSSGIASGEISPGVFESVGGDNITSLEPKFTKWFVQYAGTSIVVAYNPDSKYAPQFKAIASGKKPLTDLFTLMETPGFKLGRTDPDIDPQGRAFIYMLKLAQLTYHLPVSTVSKILGGPAGSPESPQIFTEASLDSTLQSGQLDAASAYLNQAAELHLPYIPLPDSINLGNPRDAAQYAKAKVTITSNGEKSTKAGVPLTIDITTIGTPAPAALAFVKYVLSPAGLALYKQGGYRILTPTVTGTGVPAAIRSEVGG